MTRPVFDQQKGFNVQLLDDNFQIVDDIISADDLDSRIAQKQSLAVINYRATRVGKTMQISDKKYFLYGNNKEVIAVENYIAAFKQKGWSIKRSLDWVATNYPDQSQIKLEAGLVSRILKLLQVVMLFYFIIVLPVIIALAWVSLMNDNSSATITPVTTASQLQLDVYVTVQGKVIAGYTTRLSSNGLPAHADGSVFGLLVLDSSTEAIVIRLAPNHVQAQAIAQQMDQLTQIPEADSGIGSLSDNSIELSGEVQPISKLPSVSRDFAQRIMQPEGRVIQPDDYFRQIAAAQNLQLSDYIINSEVMYIGNTVHLILGGSIAIPVILFILTTILSRRFWLPRLDVYTKL